ncbi:MAG: glucosidase [Candidatus Bathyarchaeota archaeon]|nr:glucosidase [Candidatus Bathyarchaeota archaeon]
MEIERLSDMRLKKTPWHKWGPYLSERQWGTVREDYSKDGAAWDYFSHDQARSRAYRWGEDGLAGICDENQKLCFAVALWNGQDPILKERLFGLTNSEGNHGEDVKEYYFYLDNTPTHSYMKYLYKYPQRAYPYLDLVETNRQRTKFEFEYELLDTGIFDDDRYFDVFVEYAKGAPEDILIKISAYNRGREPADLHILPTLWFRNTWYGSTTPVERPSLLEITAMPNVNAVEAHLPNVGRYYLYCEPAPLLFTENETNNKRLFGTENATPYVKDGINNYVVNKEVDAVDPAKRGTKVSADYQFIIPSKEYRTVKLRLTNLKPEHLPQENFFGADFNEIFNLRKDEADEFFNVFSPSKFSADQKNVLRQAVSGMLWNKQYYEYDVAKWLTEHHIDYYNETSDTIRNRQWFHMMNGDVISMPDKWEYPWYAAWDLAFHTMVFSLFDPEFAKQQLKLMLTERYLHPNGQFPAYEWNFNDVNPPVHAWAVLFNYYIEEALYGKGDLAFVEDAFQKLLMNFTWWVNRVDSTGKNIFAGGFLGLDNIGLFDRSAKLPLGVTLDQADGTAWMAMFCQNMLTLAVLLARHNPIYEEQAIKFFEHFLWIAHAMATGGPNKEGLWDEEDGFFYDNLRLPDGRSVRLKVRSMVGLIALCATSVFPGDSLQKMPRFAERAAWFTRNHPELVAHIHRPGVQGLNGTFMIGLLDESKLRRILERMLDENEFFSPYGIRSLSKSYAEQPYKVDLGGQSFEIEYAPAESTTGAFGGNSNWRGPVWFPINLLLIRALINLYSYYGDDFKVECPTGSGRMMNFFEVSQEIATRLERIFLKDSEGKRPVYGGSDKFQNDPYWRDNILFYEYFHGDNGAGVGASHQTGWTGLIATLMRLYGSITVKSFGAGRKGLYENMVNYRI